MVLALNKTNLKNIPYGKEVGFARGIRGRASKDGLSVKLLIHKKMPRSKAPVRAKIGTYPDMSIDQIEEVAREYRRLIEEGTHPYEWQLQRDEERLLSKKERERRNITLWDLVAKFEDSRQALGRSQTEKHLRARRGLFIDYFGDRIREPVAKTDREYLDGVLRKGREANDLKNTIKAIKHLKTVLNYAVNDLEIIPNNPCDKFKFSLQTSSRKQKEALLPQECNDVLKMIGHLTSKDQKDNLRISFSNVLKPRDLEPSREISYLAIALYLLTGIRQQELLQLRWSDVYLEKADYQQQGAVGPFFTFYQTKQGKHFGIPITKYMIGSFKSLWERKRNEYVFPTSREGGFGPAPLATDRKSFETLRALLPHLKLKLTQKLCRATFATSAHRLHYTLDQIDMYTGHTGKVDTRNVATTAYIMLEADNARQAFEQINAYMIGGYEELADLKGGINSWYPDPENNNNNNEL